METPVLSPLRGLDPELDSERLDRALGDSLARAREGCPGLDVDEAAYRAFVVEKLPHSGDRVAALSALNAADLLLACACAAGDARALARFEARYGRTIDEVLRKLRVAPQGREEIVQLARMKLFVARQGRRPAIGKYSGRGSLARWLQVTVSRLALRQIERQPDEIPAQSDLLQAVPDSTDDPELRVLKRLYREEFRAAFGAAIAELTPRERNVLRHQLLDRLSIDEIGGLYSVHRATAARWILRARARLVAQTERAMMQRLRIARAEYESILRLIRSRLDLAISQYLRV